MRKANIVRRFMLSIKGKARALRDTAAASAEFLKQKMQTLRKTFVANLWQKYYRASTLLVQVRARLPWLIWLAIAIPFVIGSIVISAAMQEALEPFFEKEVRQNALWGLLVSLGGALVAAAAISFSMIVFSLQVNVERMPHRLFWRFRADTPIFLAFIGTLVSAISVSVAGLVQDKSLIAISIICSIWAIIFMVAFITYAYRRSLYLINPIKQLTILLDDTRREFMRWSKFADRTRPLMRGGENIDEGSASYDATLSAIFQLYPRWNSQAKQAIEHSISYAKRFATNGDYQVSEQALSVIAVVNSDYIATKKRTFFSTNGLIDNPLTRDAFFSFTLEQLRQLLLIATSKKDEQLAEQVITAMANLAGRYSAIEYPQEYASKTHATLALRYLVGGIESVSQQGMTDVVMQGVRLAGGVCRELIARKCGGDAVSSIEAMAKMGYTACIKPETRPITLSVMEQLSDLLFVLLRSEDHNVRFVSSQIRQQINLVSTIVLHLKQSGLENHHSFCLAPYYSSTTTDSFRSNLTQLVNALLNEKNASPEGRQVCTNISEWADGISQTEKELLLLAISQRSNFTFDITHFITAMCELLLACGTALSCADHVKEKLIKEADWLFSTLSWIPKDKETVTFVASYQLDEQIVSLALKAKFRGYDEFLSRGIDLLLQWAFEAGRHRTGWGILEHSIYGLCALSLSIDTEQAPIRLKDRIQATLNTDDAPDKEMRDKTARALREKEVEYNRWNRLGNHIDHAMSGFDRNVVGALLIELADILSPDTKGEPVRRRF